jgi:hypothetical protein
MTYDASESSAATGRPVELYRFTQGTDIWTHTSADMAITFQDEVYAPAPIRRGELPQNEERETATMDVYLDPSLDLVVDFISGATPAPMNLTLLRRHRDVTGLTEQAVQFIGQVGVVEFSEGEVHMTCVPMQKAVQRQIPRWLYQTQCNHMLYDEFCTVNPIAFTFPGTISAITGKVLTVPEAAGKPDGYYNGGFIKDGNAYAFIQTHVGTQFNMLAITYKFRVGDTIATTAGCDRTVGTCASKFANLANNMSFPYMPDKNPYSGGLT